MSSRAMQTRITIRGRVAPHWAHWLEELQLSYRTCEDGSDITDLTGTLADQCALHGVLNRIWNLNLTVLSVSTAPADARRAGPDG